MYYVVARPRGSRQYMASINQDPTEAQRLFDSLQREGIPSFLGEAADVSSTDDPRLKQALGLVKEN